MKKRNHGTQQHFSFTAPAATSVQLVGDFTHWQDQPINLSPGKGGTWQTAVELAPGTHRYRFLVDGHWKDDPECKARVDNPFGTQDSIRQVS